MLKLSVVFFTLCSNSIILTMAHHKKNPQDNLAKTIAILNEKGKMAQKDRSAPEEKTLTNLQQKRKIKKEEKAHKQNIIQEIIQHFPGAPTPDNIYELKSIYRQLFKKEYEEK